jgi:hypothetical protein
MQQLELTTLQREQNSRFVPHNELFSQFPSRCREERNSMRQKNCWFVIGGIFAVFALVMMLPTEAVAVSNYKIQYKFTGGNDGGNPTASLIFDASGNLYGTTENGGSRVVLSEFLWLRCGFQASSELGWELDGERAL